MHTEIRVQVVIVNWRRPMNIPKIVKAFRNQTIPCEVILCDVGDAQFALPNEVRLLADKWFSWSHNYGGFNRYIPTGGFDAEFCWFHDDDMIPGPHLLEFMLSFEHLPFSVLGQLGRKIENGRYSKVTATEDPQQVSFVCRGYLVRTQYLHCLHKFRIEEKLPSFSLDDDILIALSIKKYFGLKAWITPSPEVTAKANLHELPAPYATSLMRNHYSRRNALIHRFRLL